MLVLNDIDLRLGGILLPSWTMDALQAALVVVASLFLKLPESAMLVALTKREVVSGRPAKPIVYPYQHYNSFLYLFIRQNYIPAPGAAMVDL